MAVSDLKFHSYLSLHTTADSTASAAQYNIFDEDNYSSYGPTTVSSPDITYPSSDGKVHFGASGNLGFILALMLHSGNGKRHLRCLFKA